MVNVDTFEDIEGNKFVDFVYAQVPTVDLTANQAQDIAIDQFEATNAVYKQLYDNQDIQNIRRKQAKDWINKEKTDNVEKRQALWEKEEERRKRGNMARQEKIEENRKKLEDVDLDEIRKLELQSENNDLLIQQHALKYQYERAKSWRNVTENLIKTIEKGNCQLM